MKAPCKDCPDRAATCHDSCPRYIAFKAERERISKARINGMREYDREQSRWHPRKIRGDQ